MGGPQRPIPQRVKATAPSVLRNVLLQQSWLAVPLLEIWDKLSCHVNNFGVGRHPLLTQVTFGNQWDARSISGRLMRPRRYLICRKFCLKKERFGRCKWNDQKPKRNRETELKVFCNTRMNDILYPFNALFDWSLLDYAKFRQARRSYC